MLVAEGQVHLDLVAFQLRTMLQEGKIDDQW